MRKKPPQPSYMPTHQREYSELMNNNNKMKALDNYNEKYKTWKAELNRLQGIEEKRREKYEKNKKKRNEQKARIGQRLYKPIKYIKDKFDQRLYKPNRVRQAWLSLGYGEVGPGFFESLTPAWRRKLENELKRIKADDERIQRNIFIAKSTKNITTPQRLLEKKIKVRNALKKYNSNIKLLEIQRKNFFKIPKKHIAEGFEDIYYLNNNRRNIIKNLINKKFLSPNNWNPTMESRSIHDGSHGGGYSSFNYASPAEKTIGSFMNNQKGNRFRLDEVENSIRNLEAQIELAKAKFNNKYME